MPTLLSFSANISIITVIYFTVFKMVNWLF